MPLTTSLSSLDMASAMRHWHPVCLSSELKTDPAPVMVLGHQIVLFRTAEGKVAAIDDRCPHRGARLSTGHVEGDCIVCPYHLWRFDGNGLGSSPVNPRMKPFTTPYDAAELHGFVWLKSRDSDVPMPSIDTGGMYPVGHLADQIETPFPLVVDNFTEIEHSPTNHFLFAFDERGIEEVEPKVEVAGNVIHVIYAGPQRPVPWWTLAGMAGMKAGTRLTIDFELKFSPIHWTYNMLWDDPKTGRRLPQRIREFAFITPRDEKSTSVFLLFFSPVNWFAPSNPLAGVARGIFLSHVRHEFLLDRRICENVYEMDPKVDLDGFQLGKFDFVLRTARNLINTAYYQPAAMSVLRD